MATVPHSPATAPRAELIETIVRKHSVSFVLWRGTAPAAACSTVSPASTLHYTLCFCCNSVPLRCYIIIIVALWRYMRNKYKYGV